MLEKVSPTFFGQSAQNRERLLERILDVGPYRVVLRQAPVPFGHAEDLHDVPVGVVVGEERLVPVSRRSARLEVAGGGRYGVSGVHDIGDPVAVAINPGGLPGRGQELHRAHRPGGRWAHVLSMVRLDLPHRRQHVPVLAEPVLPGGFPVQHPVLFSGDRAHRTGDYLLARDPQLVAALRLSPTGGGPLPEDASPLRCPKLLQPGLRSRLVLAYARYYSFELFLVSAEFLGLRSLLLQGSFVVTLFLRDLARRVVQDAPGLPVSLHALPAIEQDLGDARIGETVRRAEQSLEQEGEPLQAATLVGGPRLLLIPGLRSLEGLPARGALPLQLPGLLFEVTGARLRAVHPSLRLLQLGADGGDLADLLL